MQAYTTCIRVYIGRLEAMLYDTSVDSCMRSGTDRFGPESDYRKVGMTKMMLWLRNSRRYGCGLESSMEKHGERCPI